MPAMRPKRRSSGVATAEAIVSGLAPGKLAETEMVGYSTRGSGATGSLSYARMPVKRSASARSDVAIGRRMNGAETFIEPRYASPSEERRRDAERRGA